MSDFKYVDKAEQLPTNKEYYIALNEKLKAYGLPLLIITDNAVYKDELHALLGIGIELDS